MVIGDKTWICPNCKRVANNCKCKAEYYDDLIKRQTIHLEKIKMAKDPNWQPCMHDRCIECQGTGIKLDGSTCIHIIACRCPKCSPGY
ncbi:MAG: hypothetical protein ACTSSK_03545 [Candidatus Heimdallarchaeota archaeon]